jgi:hypothetical protein
LASFSSIYKYQYLPLLRKPNEAPDKTTCYKFYFFQVGNITYLTYLQRKLNFNKVITSGSAYVEELNCVLNSECNSRKGLLGSGKQREDS